MMQLADVEAQLARAERYVGGGDALGAEKLLVPLFAYPDGLGSGAAWGRALAALAQVAEELYWPRELTAALARADVDQADSLGTAGAALIAERRPAFAAGLLGRAVSLAPQRVGLLTDLVAALEQLGRHDAALAALQAAPAAHTAEFLPRYLEAFSRVMTGDLDGARTLHARLSPDDSRHAFMRARLDRIFARADAVTGTATLDANDVRGWHFVITGSLLLIVPPDMDEPGRVARRGRFTLLEDDDALIFASAHKLGYLLQAIDIEVPQVIALDEPASRITGRAISRQLVVPIVVDIDSDAPGLVCAYDFAAIPADLVGGYRSRRPGQLTFAHLAPYGAEQAFVPDFVGALYGKRYTPWTRHLVTPQRPGLPTGPPTEDEKTLAQRIVDALAPDWALDDLGDLVALAVIAQGEDALPMLSGEGQREPLWVGGPVVLPE